MDKERIVQILNVIGGCLTFAGILFIGFMLAVIGG